jgi:predicted nucleic acid-binding protein
VAAEAVVLDTCVAINLFATGDLGEIGRVLDTIFLMADRAAAEMGYLRDDVGGEVMQTPIDLARYSRSGTVQILSLAEGDLPQYVKLAAMVDDGEAATIAIAQSRKLAMATDDRKARRVCAELGLPEPKRSLAILRAYAQAAALTDQGIRERLIRVKSRASLRPGQPDPDYKWWSLHVGEE